MNKIAKYQILSIEPSKDGGWNIRIQKLAKLSRADKVFITVEKMNLFGLMTGEFYSLTLTRMPNQRRAIIYAYILPLASFLLLRWIRHTQFLENGTNISKFISTLAKPSTINVDELFRSIHRGAFSSASVIPYRIYHKLVRAWSERVNAVSTCSFLQARNTPASLWKPLSMLYGRRVVQVLKSKITALTPFLDREDLARFLKPIEHLCSQESLAAISLIYAMSDHLKSGTSLIHKSLLTDEQLSGLHYCLEHSIIVRDKDHIQLNSPYLIEASIRHYLKQFKPSSAHKFSHDEVVDAINRASTFCRVALIPEERQSLIDGANKRISCIHSDRVNGDDGLEITASIVHELLFGEPSIIVNCCAQVFKSSLVQQHSESIHISQFSSDQFVPPTEQHQFIITNSNYLSIDDLYRFLNTIKPSSKVLFIGRLNHIQVSVWGSPYPQLYSTYSGTPLKNQTINSNLSLPQVAALGKIVLSSNTSLADACHRCIHNETFPMIATSIATIQTANHLIQGSLTTDRQPILLTSVAKFYANDRLLSRRSVVECGIIKHTFAQLISCTSEYAVIKVLSQYRKISLSNFLQADFTLGYCTSLEVLGGTQLEQAIVYLDTSDLVTLTWVNTLVWTSSMAPVINYPSAQVNEIIEIGLPLMQNITPGFQE